ncbi:unnamed protein product [Ambrosiozyma monospora]|uniref:Unnamed protein product n=1 Tax=Ambrosiozyma monospora TaxID=43982 RepID=A0A9W6Z380_AMBMO|nr:unnamed protein product [Ambrosiozyma monospora]
MGSSSLDALNKLRGKMAKADSQSTLMSHAMSPMGSLQQQQQQQQQAQSIFQDDFSDVVLETVSFVGMIVRAFNSKAQLIDAQTGTLIKEFPIGQFKTSTFQVFHPEPSHCRFCGCASVASFSIAYTEIETNTLIMHTFSIDNRAKNNICLRVERDARETRCLGFASVTEHQHWLGNVEGWCASDLNMLMGVRRKEKEDISNYSDLPSQSSSFKLLEQLSGNEKPYLRNRHRHLINDKPMKHPKLSDIWEGWTMSSNGQVRYYEIPNGTDSGLLIKRLGPVRKFGHKSIVVSFGNIMKILYLGNDNLIEEGDTDGESLSPLSQTSSSLSFINRRRKMTLKKYELTHSTNFNDSPGASVTEDDENENGNGSKSGGSENSKSVVVQDVNDD